MPPDYADFVIDGSREELRHLYNAVVTAEGAKAAEKASIKHARMVADVWASKRQVQRHQVVSEVDTIIRTLISGAA